MSVQDDAREDILVKVFNLRQDDDRARHDPDAYLDFQSHRFYFELKSTTKKSISTVRDFGPDHIEKWLDMHWIVGFFKSGTKSPTYCYYLAPRDMREWTNEIWSNIKFDFEMADLVAGKIGLEDLYSKLGAKNLYTLADAKAIQKSQYLAEDYKKRMDVVDLGFSSVRLDTFRAPFIAHDWVVNNLGRKRCYTLEDQKALIAFQCGAEVIAAAISPKCEIDVTNADKVFPSPILPLALMALSEKPLTPKGAAKIMRKMSAKSFVTEYIDITPGYSPTAMLEILRDRCRYLIRRGATLNNPHIPESFFSRFDRIEDEHASQLRSKLRSYLEENPPEGLVADLEHANM